MSKFPDSCPCTIYPLAKQKCLYFPSNEAIPTSSFNLIHCDLGALFSILALDGSKYSLTIIDDYSKSNWVYLMQNKSQTKSYL